MKTITISDETYEKIKSELHESEKTPDLASVFQAQVDTLIQKSYPEAAGMEKDKFLSYLNSLKEQFVSTAPQEGNVNLIVIPENFVPLYKQMSLVELEGKSGYSWLSPHEITNEQETPRKPYIVFDVENGKAMQGKSPEDASKELKKQKRHGLSAQEGIALITHYPEILKDHYIDLPGSRYHSAGGVPVLCLDGGRPRLGCFDVDYASPRWGSASFKSRS